MSERKVPISHQLEAQGDEKGLQQQRGKNHAAGGGGRGMRVAADSRERELPAPTGIS